MKLAMCFGTFDNLHPGHEDYFKQAAISGYQLLIVIARDETVKRIKKCLPQEDENLRLEKVNMKIKPLGIKGEAVLGSTVDRWEVIKKYKPEIIFLGYDQEVDLQGLQELIRSEKLACRIERLKPYYPNRYKSKFCINPYDR